MSHQIVVVVTYNELADAPGNVIQSTTQLQTGYNDKSYPVSAAKVLELVADFLERNQPGAEGEKRIAAPVPIVSPATGREVVSEKSAAEKFAETRARLRREQEEQAMKEQAVKPAPEPPIDLPRLPEKEA